MKRALLSVIFLASVLTGWAQNPHIHFRNFSTDEGLPDNSVRAIFQDSDGLIWLCTREGICMYDGLHFKPLEDPSCDILDGLAMSIAEDPQHRLWFITTRGIGFHDLTTGETRTSAATPPADSSARPTSPWTATGWSGSPTRTSSAGTPTAKP